MRLGLRPRLGPYRVFSAYGGSGSSWLLRRIDAFRRPDVWQPWFRGRPLEEWKCAPRPVWLLGPEGLDSRLPPADWAPFLERTRHRFPVDPSATVGDNLAGLCAWVVQRRRSVVLVHSAILGLFSRYRIPKVTFLVRHPVDGYLSFALRQHPVEIRALGGIESPRAIALWTDRWNAVAEEYRRCRELGLAPVLIRFEQAAADARCTPWHERLFRRFSPPHRPPPPERARIEDAVLAAVADHLPLIYPAGPGDPGTS